MAVTGAVGGIVFFKVNGMQYRLEGSVKIRWGGAVRTDVIGADLQDYGWTEKATSPGFDLTLIDAGNMSLATLMAISPPSTATLELNTGKTYVCNNIRVNGEIDHDAMDGKIPIKIGCSFPIIEQLASA